MVMAPLDVTAEELVAEARERIEEVSPEEAMKRHGHEDVVFVDVRDEIEVRGGEVIVGAEHVSRGLVEFKADPTDSHHDPTFDPEKRYVCYCAVGLRSTFVADQLGRMGYDIANLAGGIEAWREADGEVAPYEAATA